MLQHFYSKKLHNRNVVTLNVIPSPLSTQLLVYLPMLEAMLIHELRPFCLNCIYGLEPGSF